MMWLKKAAAKIVYGHKSDEKSYARWLRQQGVAVGKNVHFYSPWTIRVDTQRPWMIEIGDNVHITADCSILQHDYSWSILEHQYGDVLGSCGKVHIGNNVFIGQKSLILKGAYIDDNTILGAGSVVSKKLEGNAVYAGVPAKKLMSLDEFYRKRQEAQKEEAVSLVCEYIKTYGHLPKPEALREFYWLFSGRDISQLGPIFKDTLFLNDSFNLSAERFKSTEPLFSDFQDFLSYCESMVK